MPVYAHPARLYQSQAVLTTSPGHLVLMLYDGVLRFLGQAEEAFALPEEAPRRIERIDTAITRAQNILAELNGNLDHEAGGEYSAQLARLYDYYLRQRQEAGRARARGRRPRPRAPRWLGRDAPPASGARAWRGLRPRRACEG